MRVSIPRCLLAFSVGLFLSACGDVDFFFISNPGIFDDLDQTGGIIIVSTDDDDEAVQSVTLITGEIPPGTTLTEDGRLIGTPEETGLFEFTVEIVSADGKTTLRTVTLAVNED